jgi:YfiH family protein
MFLEAEHCSITKEPATLIELQYEDLQYLQFSQISHQQPFPELIHGVFTRLGGFSPPPYQGLNTSTPVRSEHRDSVDNVIRNRQRVLQALNMQDYPCVTLWQVHGAGVATFKYEDEWRTDWAYHSYYERTWTPQSIRKADALITRERGIGLALSFADCTPIIFYDPVEQVIGTAHGGWRGTARGIVVATVEAMREQFGCLPANIRACIGPTIGVCCYEVSEHVRQLFSGELEFDDMPTHPDLRAIVHESATFTTVQLPDRASLRLDLWETTRRQLLLAGLQSEHIEVAGICTCCNRERFFSYRGENGITGRFAVMIALKT